MAMSLSSLHTGSGQPASPESQLALHRAAAHYLSNGLSILPLAGKRPNLERWKELQGRRPTVAEVDAWFISARPPPTGVGIITGAVSGLVVVDCDSVADADFWEAQFPRSPSIVATGGGGKHYYYAMPIASGVQNRVGVQGRRIDVRGEGGYVAAPPSLHASGTPYEWRSVDWDAPLPTFDLNWVANTKPAFAFSVSGHGPLVRNVVAYIGRIEAVSGQGGHNATFRAACRLRDAGVSPVEALAILSHWNETNATPPWSAPELAHKIRSAFASNAPRDLR